MRDTTLCQPQRHIHRSAQLIQKGQAPLGSTELYLANGIISHFCTVLAIVAERLQAAKGAVAVRHVDADQLASAVVCVEDHATPQHQFSPVFEVHHAHDHDHDQHQTQLTIKGRCEASTISARLSANSSLHLPIWTPDGQIDYRHEAPGCAREPVGKASCRRRGRP